MFQHRGCISQLRFQKSADDLTMLVIDGHRDSDGNLSEFREVLLYDALAMKCVSLCRNTEKKRERCSIYIRSVAADAKTRVTAKTCIVGRALGLLHFIKDQRRSVGNAEQRYLTLV